MASPKMDDRRKNPRVAVDVPVRLLVGKTVVPGRLKDICRDAALVEVEAPQTMGTLVTLTVDLPGTGGPLVVSGEVIRLAPAEDGRQGAALLFTDLPSSAGARIEFFLALQSGSVG